MKLDMEKIHDNQEVEELKKLVQRANFYRDAYYNKNTSIISDKEYDELYDQINKMEEELGVIFSNSPTQTVGYEIQSKLKKVTHDHLMLSLGKTKKLTDVIKFINQKPVVLMLKMDGLTCSLSYDKYGDLIKAETRGNGSEGEDVLKNAKFINNIPLHINNGGIPVTIDGEVIIDYKNFEEVNKKLNKEEQFSHPRNLASGTIRQLNTKITAERKLSFIAWKVIAGLNYNNLFSDSLYFAKNLGFDIVPFIIYNDNEAQKVTEEKMKKDIDYLKLWATKKGYPIDGIVISYQDISYGKSLGETAHHPLHSLALKFYDDEHITFLRDIEWTPSRTGVLSPVGIFDAVDLDGAITTRATLHNVSIIKSLQLGIGDKITVIRANQVIPKINNNLTKSNSYVFPEFCPCCGTKLEIQKIADSENLICPNKECGIRKLNRFEHFVSKDGMNIEGLSKSTLEKLLNKKLLNNFIDIYNLKYHIDEISTIDGFKEKSINNLLKAIEKSRTTKLENYLYALGIPLIGKVAAKDIAQSFHGDYNQMIDSFTNKRIQVITDDEIGIMKQYIYEWFNMPLNLEMSNAIANILHFEKEESVSNKIFEGMTICVTGGFNNISRKEIEEKIIALGGKIGSSVTKKTSYIITNEINSGSSKAKKALSLGTPVLNEEDFINKIKGV